MLKERRWKVVALLATGMAIGVVLADARRRTRSKLDAQLEHPHQAAG